MSLELSKIFNVSIFNTTFNSDTIVDNITYKNLLLENYDDIVTDIFNSTVIVQRNFFVLMKLHQKNPHNTYYLWSHDYLEKTFYHLTENIEPSIIHTYFMENKISIIAVSKFHEKNIKNYFPNINVIVIYNALFKDYYPKNNLILKNEDSIVFASNWGKGIDNVLKIGQKYYQKNKHFKLVLVKPSYCSWEPDLSQYPFVVIRGTITNKKEYSELLQSCLCVLTPSYPETFGCVFAEALHLGTPVIADSGIDAGFKEFIDSKYMCNFKMIESVVLLIEQIRKKKIPSVVLEKKFYDDQIVQQWINLIYDR